MIKIIIVKEYKLFIIKAHREKLIMKQSHLKNNKNHLLIRI